MIVHMIISVASSAQDNIKDKMRSVPIEVSTDISGARRQRTRNGLPPLLPILDSSKPNKDVAEVNEDAAEHRSCLHSVRNRQV